MCMSAQRCVGRPLVLCHADGGMNAYARRHFFADCCR